MLTVNAYAAPSATAPLVPATIQRRDLGPCDVLVDIKFCGVCHTDIHTTRGEWGDAPYPLVPGHEITGVVASIGPAVTRHGVGDRVGVGWMVGTCRKCENCRNGAEQYCQHGRIRTHGSVDLDGTITQGGYATHIVVPEDFALRIPDGLELGVAAPLLCAGITTYSPLRHWRAGAGTRVAVVGLGGLGHLAVRFAHALGAEVDVLSRSPDKRDDALRFGADRFHATTDPTVFTRLAGRFDLILNTVSGALDLDSYLSLVAVDGTLVNVGAPPDRLSVNAFSLIRHRRSLAGSLVGGLAETREMLDFCVEHGIGAEVEVIPADGINDAHERIRTTGARYRFVLDTATLG